MMKKFLLTVPVLVLLAASCSQNPAAQQNTQNSNLKTYFNTDYGFQFSYPSTYVSKEYDKTQVPGELFVINLTGPTSSGLPYSMSVSVWDNSNQLSLVDWATANSSFSNYSSSSLKTDFKNETLAGHKAISYSWVGLEEGKTVVIANDKTILLLDVGSNKAWQDFDGVISSLKFVK